MGQSSEALERRRQKALKKTEDKAIALIAQFGHLEKTITPEASNGSYFSLPTGRVMSREVCERLIAGGRLIACRDGLFGDSQTFVPAQA